MVWLVKFLNGGNLFTKPLNWIFEKIQFLENCRREFHFCQREIDYATFASALFSQKDCMKISNPIFSTLEYIQTHVSPFFNANFSPVWNNFGFPNVSVFNTSVTPFITLWLVFVDNALWIPEFMKHHEHDLWSF